MADNSAYSKLRRKVPKAIRIPMIKMRDRISEAPPLSSEIAANPKRLMEVIQDYAMSFGPFMLIFTNERHDDGVYLHLSVSHAQRYPTWDELMHLRAVFFEDDAEVFQVMPACDEYVNIHSTCFHLWHKRGGRIIQPDRRIILPS